MNDGKKIIVSGMRPTGRLHLGNWFGALKNWVSLQDEYLCYFFIADWHSLTTASDSAGNVEGDSKDMLVDWLAAGLDPEKTVIFRQSDIKEHAELYLLLSMITPTSWLLRNPTFKEQLHEMILKKYKGQEDKVKPANGATKKMVEAAGGEEAFVSDLSTHGFLGYPVLQAADILVYDADFVPVGKDQIPHLELTREIARRFNGIFKEGIFREPRPMLTASPSVPGTDSVLRKMSKSYGNTVDMGEEDKSLEKKVMGMYTDPLKVRADSQGHPEGCVVFAFWGLYDARRVGALEGKCKRGEIGCVECKRGLFEAMRPSVEEFREKRKRFENAFPGEVLKAGAEKAARKAAAKLSAVRRGIFR